MKKNIQLSLAFFTVLFFVSFSNAQEKTGISAEKQKLIAEMIVVTRADQQVSEITDTMLTTLDATLPKMVDNIVANAEGLTAQEKENLGNDLKKRLLSFNEKFRKRLPQVVDYPQFIRDVMYPLYDKFFTEKELSELIVFYKTPTGQKLISATPQLVSETMELTEKLLLPKIEKLADELIEEEFKSLESSPPPASRPDTE